MWLQPENSTGAAITPAASAMMVKVDLPRCLNVHSLRLAQSAWLPAWHIVVPLGIPQAPFQGIPGTLCYANLDSVTRLAACSETYVQARAGVH